MTRRLKLWAEANQGDYQGLDDSGSTTDLFPWMPSRSPVAAESTTEKHLSAPCLPEGVTTGHNRTKKTAHIRAYQTKLGFGNTLRPGVPELLVKVQCSVPVQHHCLDPGELSHRFVDQNLPSPRTSNSESLDNENRKRGAPGWTVAPIVTGTTK